MKPAIWTSLYAEQPLHEALKTLYDHGWTAFEVSTEHLVQIETADDAEVRIDRAKRCLSELDLWMPCAPLVGRGARAPGGGCGCP
jgi:sugar phosphate isomerase/epimerase